MAVPKLFESDDFIIVNKPFDMYINSDDENEKNTVTCHIASHDSHLSTSSNPLYFVQRLDYSTSGILCIAKNKTAASIAGKLFEKRLSKKYYLAIVRGHIKFELADIKYAIGVDLTPGSGHKMSPRTEETTCGDPRSAHTRLLVLETGFYCGDPVSVVLLKPVTGRRHQLRVHCKSIGFTILGDYTYSNSLDCSPHRMFLHAARLVLPFQKYPLDIQTPEPFFSEPQFKCKWKPQKFLYKFRSKEDFKATCDVIDKNYTVGIKYMEYCYDLYCCVSFWWRIIRMGLETYAKTVKSVDMKQETVRRPAFYDALRINRPLRGQETCLGRHFLCIVLTGMSIATIGIITALIVLLISKYGYNDDD